MKIGSGMRISTVVQNFLLFHFFSLFNNKVVEKKITFFLSFGVFYLHSISAKNGIPIRKKSF